MRSEPEQADGPGHGALLEVRHETVYVYHQPVELAHHIAFLRPRHDERQQLFDFSLAVAPIPVRIRHETDTFGNTRSVFSLLAPHSELRVLACSRVRTAEAVDPAAWADGPDAPTCREHWRYVAGRSPDAATGFVFASPMVPLHAALRDWALPSFPPGRPLAEAAVELMQRLHGEFDYEPRSTRVDTPLMEAFAQRRGVCQDFAHVMIGALRSLGLSARYVSGYLQTEPAPGQESLQGGDASHAWLAVALPRRGGEPDWLELDPTNNCIAGRSHVRLAFGRDYGDVTPLRGVIRGGGEHHLEVRVSTRPIAGAADEGGSMAQSVLT